MRRPLGLGFALIFLLAATAAAQGVQVSAAQSASLCELLKNPATYDRKRVQVRGRINLEFEDFSIYDVSCNTSPMIWLVFGGDVSTPTMSTVNDTNRPEGQNIRINGIEYTIVKDDAFKSFRTLVTATKNHHAANRVTAALTGTFLQGKMAVLQSGQKWMRGYGHMGCCHLLIIEQVSDVESKPMTKGDVDEIWRTMKKENSN